MDIDIIFMVDTLDIQDRHGGEDGHRGYKINDQLFEWFLVVIYHISIDFASFLLLQILSFFLQNIKDFLFFSLLNMGIKSHTILGLGMVCFPLEFMSCHILRTF